MCLYIVVFDFIYYTQTRFTNEIDNIVLSIELYGWCRILMVKNIVIISFFSFCIVFLRSVFKRRRWIRQIYYLPTLTFFCAFIYIYDFLLFKFTFFFYSLVRKIIKLLLYQCSWLNSCCTIIMIKILIIQSQQTSDLSP